MKSGEYGELTNFLRSSWGEHLPVVCKVMKNVCNVYQALDLMVLFLAFSNVCPTTIRSKKRNNTKIRIGSIIVKNIYLKVNIASVIGASKPTAQSLLVCMNILYHH
jgi:hypothetical protein